MAKIVNSWNEWDPLKHVIVGRIVTDDATQLVLRDPVDAKKLVRFQREDVEQVIPNETSTMRRPLSFLAVRRGSPAAGSHVGNTASMGRPAMAAMTPSTLVSARSPSSTFCPLRRTVKRSAMSKTSSSRCET